jgi:hypothetical protein
MGRKLGQAMLGLLAALIWAGPDVAKGACGQVVSLPTHDRTTTSYSIATPSSVAIQGRTTLVLLAGGGGRLNLDDHGCPRALKGSSLVRSLPHFHTAAFATALVDAPSDHPGDDGLKGFRLSSKHADDLGKRGLSGPNAPWLRRAGGRSRRRHRPVCGWGQLLKHRGRAALADDALPRIT